MGDIDPKAIAAFMAVALASPVLTYIAHALIDWHKTRKAQAFLEADPLVFEGARFRKLLNADGTQLIGAGRIVEMDGGRLLAASDDGAFVPFDAPEFKSMWPHWLPPEESGPGSGGQPAPVPGSAREESYS